VQCEAEELEHVQCNGAEQIQPKSGEVEVLCEAEELVNEAHVQCEVEVLEEVQFNGAEQVQPESVEVEVEVQNLVESQVQPESGVL